MNNAQERERKRSNRHTRLRKKIKGTTQRPRMCLHRSHRNLQVQIVDDTTGKVLLGMSTLSKGVSSDIKYGGNKEAAAKFGAAFGNAAKEKGIKQVSFDRGGCIYHGRVKAFADAAREAGLEF